MRTRRVLFLFLTMFILLACGPRMRAAPELEVPQDQALIERGEYIANHLAICVTCHSERLWDEPGAPPNPDGRFAGGNEWSEETVSVDGRGFPGSLYSTNLTQHPEYGLGAWTDGEVMRAIREGVNRDGKALLLHPYQDFRHMTDRDVFAVIAYLRTLEPIANEVPPRDTGFLINFFVNRGPEPLDGPVAPPAATDAVSRGAYLTEIAGCAGCHTPMKGMAPDPDRYMSGGTLFHEHGHTAVPSNLTPDPETGLGQATYEEFETAMREGVSRHGQPLSPLMPRDYAGLTDEDMQAIWAYLQSIPAIENDVSQAWEKARN